MARVIFLYEEPRNQEQFEAGFRLIHFPLLRKIPHLKNATMRRVEQVQYRETPYYLIAELEFSSPEALREGMSSAEGQAALNNARESVWVYLHQPPAILVTE